MVITASNRPNASDISSVHMLMIRVDEMIPISAYVLIEMPRMTFDVEVASSSSATWLLAKATTAKVTMTLLRYSLSKGPWLQIATTIKMNAIIAETTAVPANE